MYPIIVNLEDPASVCKQLRCQLMKIRNQFFRKEKLNSKIFIDQGKRRRNLLMGVMINK